ncbi:hypothetical protein [Bosea sp. 2RAB26]|uniref:hypothetical protein n=1 Tax=Bosea sp. 2RAB26 TaxID=3237476 RepID=UPI003F8E651E
MNLVPSAKPRRDRGMTFREFSDRFDISERTTSRLVAAGKVRAIQISPRRKVIMESEFERIAREGINQQASA